MKKIAKILAMFAIFALAFSFAGCKSDDSDSSDDDVTISGGSTSGNGSSNGSSSGSNTSGGGNSGSSEQIPEGFVFVEGATITGKIADSKVFIDGRTVTISDFYICDHEVTQEEYSDVMETNPSYFNSAPADDEVQENRPVEKISWYDAIVYCNKRSMKEGLTLCYSINGSADPAKWGTVPTSSDGNWNNVTRDFTANGYRLPTEAEWEYAARGGNGLKGTQYTYPGSDTIDKFAWYTSNSGDKTHEVKTKTANGLGLYDMSGNVWEWCWDWYGSISSGTSSADSASGSHRCLRGGCWSNLARDAQVAYRNYNSPDYRSNFFGFRVVRTAK
ncbi:formylglycine-generating enzyme family protein [uncultured Treponema sp.]|uniref:formylglycine-generating enzyme family protein n=1 Tax=uncultured Treponema sp. TaxID=162155 RepID=UPI00258D52A0|nr:formylglycine-generating enzyme family protein [uncultured Treponema sp.]